MTWSPLTVGAYWRRFQALTRAAQDRILKGRMRTGERWPSDSSGDGIRKRLFFRYFYSDATRDEVSKLIKRAEEAGE